MLSPSPDRGFFGSFLWRHWARCAGAALAGWWLVGLMLSASAWGKPRKRGQRWRLTPLPAPTFKTPANDLACFRMVKRKVRRHTLWQSRHPRTVKEAIRWLQRARRKGQLMWKRGAILGHIQQIIDQPRRGRLHLLFGNNHSVVGHYRFFNELLHPGKDGIQLKGLTHLALEAFVTEPKLRRFKRRELRLLRRSWSPKGRRISLRLRRKVRQYMASLIESDQQRLLDLYILKKKAWAYHFIQVVSHYLLGSAYSPSLLQEMLATLRHARKAKGKLRVLATDMSLRMRRRSSRLACWLYSLREIFGLYAVNRIATHRKHVIAYMWGSHHVRKDHFPRFIHNGERVFSVRMQGGGKPDIWDHALARLNLPMKMFAIATPGSRESDLLIHFPAKGPYLAGKIKMSRFRFARIQRQPGQLFQRPRFYRSYRNNLTKALRGLRRPLLQCYSRGRKTLTLNLTISGSGRIIRLGFPPFHKRILGWSWSCIRRRLWRLPLPTPPKRLPIQVKFKLQYKR